MTKEDEGLSKRLNVLCFLFLPIYELAVRSRGHMIRWGYRRSPLQEERAGL